MPSGNSLGARLQCGTCGVEHWQVKTVFQIGFSPHKTFQHPLLLVLHRLSIVCVYRDQGNRGTRPASDSGIVTEDSEERLDKATLSKIGAAASRRQAIVGLVSLDWP